VKSHWCGCNSSRLSPWVLLYPHDTIVFYCLNPHFELMCVLYVYTHTYTYYYLGMLKIYSIWMYMTYMYIHVSHLHSYIIVYLHTYSIIFTYLCFQYPTYIYDYICILYVSPSMYIICIPIVGKAQGCSWVTTRIAPCFLQQSAEDLRFMCFFCKMV
jgi:hypothetical protein